MSQKDENVAGAPGPHEPSGRNIDRRSFLSRIAAGLAISVPALRVLLGSTPASADPQHKHCSKLWIVYLGHSCVCGRMIGRYEARCSTCGYICNTFTDDEGPC